jgi:fucose 4-O-acetylase-like acetyltransferase
MVAFLLTDITYLVARCRRILIALSFILIGFSCKNLFMKKNIAVGVVSGLLTISIAYMNGIVDLSARQFGNPLLYILGSLIGTYYVLSVSQCLFGTLAKLLGRIGRSSLTIMGTHQNLQVLFNVFCGSVYPLPLQILVCFATIPYEILMVNLCEKFVPFLVGIPLPVKRSKKSKRITQNERTQQN